MTPSDAIQQLVKLRDGHDQTVRCEIIKTMVKLHYGENRDREKSDTELFLELMIDQLGAGT